MVNLRIEILKNEVEQKVLKPFRSHGWEAAIIAEHDKHSSIEVSAKKNNRQVGIAIVYGCATDNQHYKILETRNERIFFHGQPYRLESYTRGVNVPVEPLDYFFPFLIKLNKEFAPEKTVNKILRFKKTLRIVDENPLEAVFSRLEQFSSIKLAQKLVLRRCEYEKISLDPNVAMTKAEGIAYSMRNALDYCKRPNGSPLNNRIVSLYYGSIAFAFAEMLASPKGPSDLDEVEGMTKQGHGLYAIPGEVGRFDDIRVGVLATGFLPNWLNNLGYDTSAFPTRKAKSINDIEKYDAKMSTKLGELFGCFPELEDLYQEVFKQEPSWIIPYCNILENKQFSMHSNKKTTESTYCKFLDPSGLVDITRLEHAGFPITEITKVKTDEDDLGGITYRARIDHIGLENWWAAIPTHSSKGRHRTTLLLPSIGNVNDYRVLAVTSLYALSILVRYMPNTWRKIEGGDFDEFLAIIKTALSVWERLLPENFLESISGEHVVTTQPDSFLS